MSASLNMAIIDGTLTHLSDDPCQRRATFAYTPILNVGQRSHKLVRPAFGTM